MRTVRDFPALRRLQYALDPVYYNQAHIALLRLGCPLEIPMQKLQVSLELDHRQWIAFFMQDSSRPLIEWREFKRARNALDQPVECTLLLYHYHSWLMFPQVLVELDRQLGRQLRALHHDRPGDGGD